MRHPFTPIPRSRRRLFQSFLTIFIVLGQLWPLTAGAASVRPAPVAQTVIRFDTPIPPDGEGGGMTIVLSPGAEQPERAEPQPVAATEPLSDAETQALLDRLPPLPAEEGDEQAFRLPPESLPAPRTGDVITETFPAPESSPESGTEPVEPGPLEVLRYAPEGEIPIAPFLSVTFNQPMVPLATIEQLTAEEVPVKLTPQLPGVWKWIGTRTLTFEYAGEVDRFPKATEYTAQVPAGTTSAVGGVLDEAVRWTFRTPPPVMVNSYPGYGPQPRNPLMFVAFDQQIDPEAVLETITVRANRETFPVRLGGEEELAAKEDVARLAERAGQGRWLTFRTLETLPADATVTVSIGPGTPSAEGPLVTEEVQSFGFQTYAALRLEESWCSYGSQECPPFTPFNLIFNNPLDPETFSEDLIRVEPAIPDLIVEQFGNTIRLRGATQGRTEYTVTVSGRLQDIFGQQLGADETATFRTTDMPSALMGPNDPLVTLDPSATTPVLSVYSINYPKLMVKAYAVTPDDWSAYQAYLRDGRYYEDPRPEPPGRIVMNQTLTVEEATDQLVETPIDLSSALDDEFGHLIVTVETPTIPIISDIFGREPQFVITWVQVTRLGLDAFSDPEQLVAWATDLHDGSPLEGVALGLSGGASGISDASGVARLPLSDQPASLLVGELGDDTAILPYSRYAYWSDEGWSERPVVDELRWYVFDDHQMYRPGEEVHIKGWLRTIEGGPQGDVALPDVQGGSVRYQIMDPRGNQLGDGVAELTDLAGFDLSFSLPENTNLGYATVYFTAQGNLSGYGDSYTHAFQIQEFRRPEFEVRAQIEDEGPFYLGDEALASVEAKYFAGGPLPNAETTWTVSSQPGSYSPPNWPDFIFGEWTPWWFYPAYEYGYGYDGEGGAQVQTFEGRTDAAGKHYLKMQFAAMEDIRPYTVSAEARVTDVNRQAWASSASLLVHPSTLYVGLRSARAFVEQGDPLEIEAIVTDVDGNAVAGAAIEMTAVRLQWKYENGDWVEQEIDPQVCQVTSADEAVACTFDTANGGEYRITALVKDEAGRPNRTRFSRWVSGGQRPPARNVEQEEAVLIPDEERYQPGDVAEILVQSPFAPAEGLLTVARSGILYTERFTMDEATTTLRVPIEEAHIPNLRVQVDLVGSAPRLDDKGQPVEDAPPRPAYASGSLNLAVPPISRALSVEAIPAESALEPGAETSLDVRVTDAGGQPVAGAEVAVVVVDEAILALTNYQLADPLAIFYGERSADLTSVYGRENIVLTDPQALVAQAADAANESVMMAAGAPAPMAVPDLGMAFAPAMEEAAVGVSARSAAPAPPPGETGASPIQVRSDFNPLATFAPAVNTDANGRVTVDVKLPDNLTRYRVMAVAVADGKYFGTGESNITARMALMVRPSAPRFLNFGDRFELPVVIQNQTEQPLSVDVAVRAANLALTGDPGLRVMVPANDRVEVRFPAATVNAGTTRLQIAAASGAYADAQEVELPVYTPATTEAFATYGVVDQGAVVQPIATPANVFPQFGGLEINTSSTSLQALTDAVLYLTSYPFECSEQIASRVLGVAALRDVLSAFQAEGLPDPAELDKSMERDIARLQSLQNEDGGWPVWTRGKESVPSYSIHVAHALQRAEMKGFDTSEVTRSRALNYLRNIESYYPSYYSEQTRHTLSAYALYVRQLMGDVDPAKALVIYNEMPLEEASLEATAWLWQVFSGEPAFAAQVEEIRRHINNKAVETPGAANFTTSYGEQEYLLLHSNRRTDALILDAMINDTPDSDLIPKVVNGLLAHRTKGRWNNTQENVFVLLALDNYFNTFEAETPDFVARIWLGDTYVAEHEFAGRSTDTRQTVVPMDYLVDPEQSGGETQDLTIQKDGAGRLYYRLGMRYAPENLDLDPLEMGFVVQREYEAVDDPADVQQDEDGTWRIKAGARVRVRVHMVADNRRYHVALVDPVPAGLEIINPSLAVAEDIPADPNASPGGGWWWWGPWYQHQNLRDQRAEAFTTYLYAGVYEYSYVARATTPGRFVVPPAKAEEMYSPEVFGRSGTDFVVVE